MNERTNLTPFEQAFYDFREMQERIESNEISIARYEKGLSDHNKRAREFRDKRAEALAELKRHLTPEAFAELTAVKP